MLVELLKKAEEPLVDGTGFLEEGLAMKVALVLGSSLEQTTHTHMHPNICEGQVRMTRRKLLQSSKIYLQNIS